MARRLKYKPDVARLSPAWWLARLWNVFWVTVVTLMIWVYADLEVSELRQFTATLRLRAPKAGQVVLLTPSEMTVTFWAKGSRHSLEEFQRWLTDQDEVIEYDLSAYKPGEYKERTDGLLNGIDDLIRQGVSVQQAEPSPVVIHLDELVSRLLPIRLVHVGGVLVGEPSLNPPAVSVTAAKSVWEQIDGQADAPVIRTTRQDLSQQRTGEPVTFTAALVASAGGQTVQIDPQSVEVTLTVSQQTDQRTITVNVRVISPPEWPTDGTWEQYELQRKDPLAWRTEITVVGAKTDLDQLRPEDVQAFVELTEDDKQPVESWLDRQVQVRFPPDAQLRLAGQAPALQFKMVRRNGRSEP